MKRTHLSTTLTNLRPTAEIRAMAAQRAKEECVADPDLYTVTVEVRAPRGHTREVFQFDRADFGLPMGANID